MTLLGCLLIRATAVTTTLSSRLVFKLKAEFTTGAIDEQIAVDQLRVVANMPIRTD